MPAASPRKYAFATIWLTCVLAWSGLKLVKLAKEAYTSSSKNAMRDTVWLTELALARSECLAELFCHRGTEIRHVRQ
jgi:hypothetical protein